MATAHTWCLDTIVECNVPGGREAPPRNLFRGGAISCPLGAHNERSNQARAEQTPGGAPGTNLEHLWAALTKGVFSKGWPVWMVHGSGAQPLGNTGTCLQSTVT